MIRALVTNARNGLAGSLVLRGEPGIGKSALLDTVSAELSAVQLVRVDGFESEASIPYAALHRLGLALKSHLGELPTRLQRALRVAWGLDDGPAPERFLVGLATLGLFAAAAVDEPLICVIDDAHWLDSESLDVLAFVARRLTAESSVLLFATRESPVTDVALAGVDTVELTGLDRHDAVQLLRTILPDDIDPYSATQIADATGGNPLALTDLARDLGVRQLTELTLKPDPVPIGHRLEAHYLRLTRDLPQEAQRWLVVAAAAAGGPAELVEHAARQLGLSSNCGDAAARAGLVTTGTAVQFRHPLVRSAVYGAEPASERRRIHAALAQQAGFLGLVDLKVWHEAESVVGIDADVADQLAQAADRAGRRGGSISQAGLLARAAQLSPTVGLRNERLLAAAEAAGSVGAAQLSRELLDRIDGGALSPVERGRLLVAECKWGLFVADPTMVAGGTARLLDAARHFGTAAPERESKALLQAFEHALVAEHQMRNTTLADLGRRIQAGAAAPDPYGVVLKALAAHVLAPYDEAVPLMRAALQTLSELDDELLPEFGFVGIAFTTALFDDRAGADYLLRLATIARDNGSLRTLDTVLWVRSLFEIGRGDPAAAGMFIEHVRELRRAIGYNAEHVINVAHLAWTGAPAGDVEAIGELTRSMGFGGVHHSAQAALAAREIAEGSYAAAFSRFEALMTRPFLQVTYLQLSDFVESAARSGHLEEARSVAARVQSMATANPSNKLSALDERCRALLTADDAADPHYLRSIELLSDGVAPVELGRAHLLYGEYLRRRRQRRRAREHLREAQSIFRRVAAPSFAARAESELRATGEHVADREILGGVELAPREAAVARMAADGATNADIAAQLFITANTVDYHLRKVFQKLGVTSRRQLNERFRTAR